MDLTFLDLARFRRRPVPVDLNPDFPGLPQVRAYWEALRHDGGLPQRAALDPRGLNGVLDRVFLAERIGRGVLQVRIAGSGLVDLAGTDLRGLPLSCLFAAEARPGLVGLLEEVCQTPAVAELDLTLDRDGPRLSARLLLLPLAAEEGRNLVLGAFAFAGARPPRGKFHLLRRQVERMFPVPTAAPMQEPTAPQPGHLRLVHSRAE